MGIEMKRNFCELCEEYFTRESDLTSHLTSIRHKIRLKLKNVYQEVEEIREKNGGSAFYQGFQKAVGEFEVKAPYEQVLLDTIPWIRVYWEKNNSGQWATVQQTDAERIVVLAQKASDLQIRLLHSVIERK